MNRKMECSISDGLQFDEWEARGDDDTIPDDPHDRLPDDLHDTLYDIGATYLPGFMLKDQA